MDAAASDGRAIASAHGISQRQKLLMVWWVMSNCPSRSPDRLPTKRGTSENLWA